MLVQVYGDNAMKKTSVYKWVKRFSVGRERVAVVLLAVLISLIRTASNKQN
jgi:hypothetical protein